MEDVDTERIKDAVLETIQDTESALTFDQLVAALDHERDIVQQAIEELQADGVIDDAIVLWLSGSC